MMGDTVIPVLGGLSQGDCLEFEAIYILGWHTMLLSLQFTHSYLSFFPFRLFIFFKVGSYYVVRLPWKTLWILGWP